MGSAHLGERGAHAAPPPTGCEMGLDLGLPTLPRRRLWRLSSARLPWGSRLGPVKWHSFTCTGATDSQHGASTLAFGPVGQSVGQPAGRKRRPCHARCEVKQSSPG